jgi:hypothetical protein
VTGLRSEIELDGVSVPLRQYLNDYNRGRPHLALAIRLPTPEPTRGSGAIVRQQRLYGLINEYSRDA